MEDIELRPCPLCGGSAYIKDTLSQKERKIEIGCKPCNLKKISCFITFRNSPEYCRQLALESWNRRVIVVNDRDK